MSEKHENRKKIIFFVTRPNQEKGLTGAVLGTQTVIDSVKDHADVHIVEIKHRKISNDSKLSSVVVNVFDFVVSLFELVRTIIELGRKDLTIYLNVASSTQGLVRDSVAIKVMRLLAKGNRIIIHSRNGDFFRSRGILNSKLKRNVVRSSNAVICLSKRLIPDEKSLNALFDVQTLQGKLHIIPNTIDETLEQHMPFKTCQGRIRVLYFSNFLPEKGYLVLASAINLLHSDGLIDTFQFKFFGKWRTVEEKEEFRKLFSPTLISSGVVEISGPIWEREKAKQQYHEADVFCLPTQYKAEAQPRSILEAMANHCYVISTNHVSIPDMVLPGQNGILLDSVSAQQLAGALKNLRNVDIDDAKSESRKIFDRSFSIAKHNEKMKELFL
jgi:glycosyltransferase involved in cell wall biosynthesis